VLAFEDQVPVFFEIGLGHGGPEHKRRPARGLHPWLLLFRPLWD
jgi:hypothetical protein